MSDKPDLPTDNSALGLITMLQHLRRSGVQYLPAADAAAVQQLLDRSPVDSAATQPMAASAGSFQPRTASPAAPAPRGAAAAATRPASPASSRPVAAPRAVGAPPAEPYASVKLPVVERIAQLSQIAAEIAGCPRCEVLVRSRTQTVPGEGNPTARVCFLGEAPGADEDASGHPFVGRAGQLLTKMIEACTFTRDDVFILNTIKCRPPGNRNPEPNEIENCRPYLERQLEIIQPEYIVCLGLVAAQTILRSKLSVGRLRGQFHEYRGSKVLVTYHPSYLLREPAVKKAAWADLQFLLRDMGIEVRKP